MLRPATDNDAALSSSTPRAAVAGNMRQRNMRLIVDYTGQATTTKQFQDQVHRPTASLFIRSDNNVCIEELMNVGCFFENFCSAPFPIWRLAARMLPRTLPLYSSLCAQACNLCLSVCCSPSAPVSSRSPDPAQSDAYTDARASSHLIEWHYKCSDFTGFPNPSYWAVML